MKIGALAKRTGLPTSTIRFYESKGLLHAVTRQANGYREYPPEAVAVLSIITNAQQTGFSLDEIKQALPQDISDWQHDPLIDLLTKKVEDIETMERRLAQNKGLLITLINLIQGKPQDMDCRDNARRVMAQMGLPMNHSRVPKAAKGEKA